MAGQSGMDALLAYDENHKAGLRAAIQVGAPVGIPEFARLTGTPESSIKRAWADGVLPSVSDGIPIQQGIVALCSLPHALRGSGFPEWLLEFDALARSLLGLPARDPVEDDFGPAAPVSASAELAQVRLAHIRAQTAHALQGAKQKEFDLLVKRGEYVRTSDVELDAAECATNVIAVLQALPARIGASCAGMSALEIERRASAEIAAAIRCIQTAAMTGDWS